MRCLACNAVLTDFEATRRMESGEFLDLCNHCYHSGVSEILDTIERPDLLTVDNFEEEYPEDEAL